MWERDSEDLYSVLFMRTTGAAASLVKKFKPRAEASRNGLAVWAALKKKYMPNDESNKRVMLRQLYAMTMEEGTLIYL